MTRGRDTHVHKPVHPAPVTLHEFRNDDQWAWAGAVAVAAALRRDLGVHPRARLLVSGGSTPAPVFRALAQAPLDWERVDIALVDERWLLPEDPDSNAHLVREHLLQGHAAAARFESLTRPGRGIEAAVADANLRASQPAGILLLGMGGDGHVASLFPRMRGLRDALDSPRPYVAVDATGCAGAGPWPRRISLTPAGMAPAHTRLLLLRGDDKREVFQRALDGSDPLEMPVRIAFQVPGAQLQVYWSP
ncbi:MAG: 6-phosphogluconolactonase [Pseudomonadota bacterium]|nr:6-phosphogluconolactonase [Pseudomonadota bacterium]